MLDEGFIGLASNEGAGIFGVGERRMVRIYGLANNEGSGFMRVWMGGGGSGIHYSLKNLPIIHLIKILGYSLK